MYSIEQPAGNEAEDREICPVDYGLRVASGRTDFVGRLLCIAAGPNRRLISQERAGGPERSIGRPPDATPADCAVTNASVAIFPFCCVVPSILMHCRTSSQPAAALQTIRRPQHAPPHAQVGTIVP